MSAFCDIVDFHAHILPGADHGSYSVDETAFQLQSAAEQGITRIIATPHFYPSSHTVEEFLARREEAFSRLRGISFSTLPEICLGAEVLFCDGIEKMPDLDKLFVQGTKTLLLELPFSVIGSQCVKSVQRLVSSGVDVVLAHVDRYSSSSIDAMLEIGAKAQLNSSALSCLFMPGHIKRWLSENKVVALGSDIHNKDKTAYKSFVKAQKKLLPYLGFIKASSDEIWNLSVSKEAILQ